jgi:hypothetical protein
VDVLDRLRTEMSRFASEPYLLTVTAERDPHCGTVRVGWDASGERIVIDPPPSSWPGSAASGHQQVSLLWPPDERGGYSLIVDGDAEQSGAAQLTISISKAVLHRRGAPTAANTSSCTSDCVPLFRR